MEFFQGLLDFLSILYTVYCIPAEAVETIWENSCVLRERGMTQRAAEGGVRGGLGARGPVTQSLLRESSGHCLCLYSF